MEKIVIKGIPTSLARLIGFELGVHVYEENNLDKVDLNNEVEIIFPTTIEKFHPRLCKVSLQVL